MSLDALRRQVAHAYENTAHYRAKCDAAGVSPDDLKTWKDLSRFPFTLKGDFREHYPWGMCAVPREKLARVHASSGTTGKPTIVGYTAADLDHWNMLMARCLRTAGVRPGDLLHNAYGYGLFTGGLGFHGGAEKLGCAVVPASGGQTERQIQLILDLRPRVLCCTPSYALVLAEALAGRSTSLEIALCGAEPWSAQMQQEVEQRLGVMALDVYGLSEVLGPGVAVERPDARGYLTVWEDAFFPEIVDPDTGLPLPDGEDGELVFTSLSKEAVPVIRYRTGDLSRLHPPTGAVPYRRMERIKGRSDDMLIVRGVNIFPRQIEELILEEPALSPHYRIDVTREDKRDVLTVTVEGSGACGLGDRMKSRYGLSAVVVVVEAGHLPRSEGKARRVFDHRNGHRKGQA
ncbi:MAG: AMP-binding protein [Alphaproteobacteria bacterium]|nr:AMP-binding protein [Alphaproteobacteria bacterium]